MKKSSTSSSDKKSRPSRKKFLIECTRKKVQWAMMLQEKKYRKMLNILRYLFNKNKIYRHFVADEGTTKRVKMTK